MSFIFRIERGRAEREGAGSEQQMKKEQRGKYRSAAYQRYFNKIGPFSRLVRFPWETDQRTQKAENTGKEQVEKVYVEQRFVQGEIDEYYRKCNAENVGKDKAWYRFSTVEKQVCNNRAQHRKTGQYSQRTDAACW